MPLATSHVASTREPRCKRRACAGPCAPGLRDDHTALRAEGGCKLRAEDPGRLAAEGIVQLNSERVPRRVGEDAESWDPRGSRRRWGDERDNCDARSPASDASSSEEHGASRLDARERDDTCEVQASSASIIGDSCDAQPPQIEASRRCKGLDSESVDAEASWRPRARGSPVGKMSRALSRFRSLPSADGTGSNERPVAPTFQKARSASRLTVFLASKPRSLTIFSSH